MKDLSIFISYSHDDWPIASALSNLLQQALGPALVEAFLDKWSIPFGGAIKDTINGALERADVLIAVVAGAQPASTVSWPGYEIGTFNAYWNKHHYKQGPHKDREKQGILGQVLILSNGSIPLGPEAGNRPVNLAISEKHLSDPEDEEHLQAFKQVALANQDVLKVLKELEQLVKSEADYDSFFKERQATLADLVTDFKVLAFRELKRRIRRVSKPSKQLILRSCGTAAQQFVDVSDEATIFSVGGASNVFGKSEDDPTLFKKSDDTTPGSVRYGARWADFKASVKDHPYGAYWCGVIEQAANDAKIGGTEVDRNLVLISSNDQRYRIIATTVTTYFNNDSEVSLYLIEALQRGDRGDVETSNLLNCLTIVCRFRSAFLEGTSPYYWLNLDSSAAIPRSKAKELLMELDYLNSEAVNANLDKPGAWKDFVSTEQLTEMMTIWKEVDLALRNACNALIKQQPNVAAAPELTTDVVVQLKRLFDDVKPYNTLLGAAVTKRLLKVFERDLANQIEAPV